MNNIFRTIVWIDLKSLNSDGSLPEFSFWPCLRMLPTITFIQKLATTTTTVWAKPPLGNQWKRWTPIFFNLSPGARYDFVNATRSFDWNLFYGIHPSNEPSDPHKQTFDPQFIDPGSGKIGLNSLSGYRFKPGAPGFISDSSRTKLNPLLEHFK